MAVFAAAPTGCGPATPQADVPSNPAPRPVASAGDPAKPKPPAAGSWGTVAGRVIWAGEDAPPSAPVDVDKDKDQCLKNGPIPNQAYVVNVKNKGVRWAVVWLADPDDFKKGPPVPPELKEPSQKDVILDQPCCQFEPHVICLREGQTLIAKNSGAIPHNTKIDSGGDNPNLNPLVPPGGSVAIPGWKADYHVTAVSCSIHGWMKAWVRVFDHPYFAVTDEDGKFTIAKAPAGKWRIAAWQESAGWLAKGGKNGDPIEISPGGASEVNFEVKPGS